MMHQAAVYPAWVEVVKAAAWPVVALIAAFAFRKPLIRLVRAIGERATKLSLFNFGVELLPAARPSAGATLEEIQHLSPALIADTSSMLFQQVQDSTPADYAPVDLGKGDEWLTSRLFLAAALLQRMRGVECFVFSEPDGSIEHRFVAIADARYLRWALARRYPWLETAFARAYAEAAPTAQPGELPKPIDVQTTAAFITSDTGGLQPWVAGQLVTRFIASIQKPDALPVPPAPAAPPAPPPSAAPAALGPDWVKLGNGRFERAAWVTRQLLADLLPETAFQAWTDVPLEGHHARNACAPCCCVARRSWRWWIGIAALFA